MTLTFDQWCSVDQTFIHEGLSQRYVDTGNFEGESKDVVLLLHGYPTWSYDWVDVIPVLSVSFRVIALDWVGYGLSDKPNRHVRVEEQIDRLQAFLSERDVDSFHLVAHDYGATCAQEMLDRPALAARTKSLTLMNGGVVYDAYRPTSTQKLLLTPLGPLISRFLSKDRLRAKLDAVRGVKLTDAQFDALWQGIAHQDGNRKSHLLQRYILERAEHWERWEAAVNRYTGPVQLIWGPLDPVSGAHVLAPLRARLPDARVVELPGIGHFVPDEAPAAARDAIREFILMEADHG
ncbi:MAG: alpha/beta hydrolase [Litorimonas sp.]